MELTGKRDRSRAADAIFLQPVMLAPRCFLQEVLLWAAVQRLPTAAFFDETEWRESDELDSYAIELFSLNDEETRRLGIPPDPRFLAMIEGTGSLPVEHYDKLLAYSDSRDQYHDHLVKEREEARAFHGAMSQWELSYAAAIEYPASKVFVALREGRLKAFGRLLPHMDTDTALEILEAKMEFIDKLPEQAIPADFWTLHGIDWASSAARDETRHYCWIKCSTETVLSILPAEGRPVAGVKQIGDSFVVNASAERETPSRGLRGRPPFRWEEFHLEVADLLREGRLPAKKEAAIQHLQDWFERAQGKRPSRAAIGEKLKPYYDRFVRALDRK